MKKIFFLALFSIALHAVSMAQMGSAKQVKWSFLPKKITPNKYEINITATIADTYHLYAINAGVEGPIPTKITIAPNPIITQQGKIIEKGNKITKVEDVWGGKVNYYEKTVTFILIVNTKTAAKTNLNGKIEFMVCNDKVCLPPSEIPFKVAIGG